MIYTKKIEPSEADVTPLKVRDLTGMLVQKDFKSPWTTEQSYYERRITVFS